MELAEKLVELRKSTGMNRRKFSDYFGIPYRTVQDRDQRVFQSVDENHHEF